VVRSTCEDQEIDLQTKSKSDFFKNPPEYAEDLHMMLRNDKDKFKGSSKICSTHKNQTGLLLIESVCVNILERDIIVRLKTVHLRFLIC